MTSRQNGNHPPPRSATEILLKSPSGLHVPYRHPPVQADRIRPLDGGGSVLWKGHPKDAAELQQVIEGELARRPR